MKEKIFADGMMFKRPREGAPDFVKGAISVKVDSFTEFIKKHNKNNWVNLDLKESKEGKLYLELNTWEKSEQKSLGSVPTLKPVGYPTETINPDDIPFK
jgi:hypothetical protein